MNLTEKAAYLQGLAEGMDLGDSKESRLIRELISTFTREPLKYKDRGIRE